MIECGVCVDIDTRVREAKRLVGILTGLVESFEIRDACGVLEDMVEVIDTYKPWIEE